MKHQKLIMLGTFVLLSTSLWAQFTLDGEFRPRAIIDAGYKTIQLKSAPTKGYISQRSRISASYKKDKLETCLSIQDVHYWGDDDMYSSSGVSGNSKGVNLYQAWVALNPSENIGIKIGRQPFSFADQRVLATRGWNDYQVTYDAVLFSWKNKNGKLDVAASWNSSGATDAYYPKGKMKTLNFATYEYTTGNLNLSGLALVTGNTKADTLTDIALIGTYGVNLQYKINGFDARVTGYYQNNLNKVSSDISAYCLSVFAKKTFLNEKASIGIGADLVSGNDKTNTDASYAGVQHKFNLLYGTRHTWLGYMDFYNSIPDQGLQDYLLKGEYHITKSVLLQADYHLFRLSSDGYDLVNSDQPAHKNLGSEVDFTLKWKIMKEATLQAGYSFYAATETLEKLKSVYNKETRFPQFAYLMLTVKPTFLSSN